MKTLPAAYKHSPSLENSRAYLGSIATIPVPAQSTSGRLTIATIKLRAGNEPPPHVHEWEDEILYVLEGNAKYYCGKNEFLLEAGEHLFLPHDVPHAFDILSPSFAVVITAVSVDQRPVGFERYLLEMSEPATSLELPSGATTHAAADPGRVIRVAAAHGIQILSAEEAARVLPHYPGFGALRR